VQQPVEARPGPPMPGARSSRFLGVQPVGACPVECRHLLSEQPLSGKMMATSPVLNSIIKVTALGRYSATRPQRTRLGQGAGRGGAECSRAGPDPTSEQRVIDELERLRPVPQVNDGHSCRADQELHRHARRRLQQRSAPLEADDRPWSRPADLRRHPRFAGPKRADDPRAAWYSPSGPHSEKHLGKWR
jgi:hypothetical protein